LMIDRRQHLQHLAALAAAAALPAAAADDKGGTYDEDSILKAATDFFGQTTEGLAKVIEKAFKEQGRPNAYIKGE
ncbi:EipA family protein, partial [Serratia marcescens]|uniref:EipA family protein n=1 Tax=Serratia marcescens TaxID=615 RepID=UPI00195467FB